MAISTQGTVAIKHWIKEAETVSGGLWFDISDLRQLSLDQIVTYTEQRQLVRPRQAELQSLLSLFSILFAQLRPPS